MAESLLGRGNMAHCLKCGGILVQQSVSDKWYYYQCVNGHVTVSEGRITYTFHDLAEYLDVVASNLEDKLKSQLDDLRVVLEEKLRGVGGGVGV